MIIFGEDGCDKAAYDSATVYHDGKWVMFDENIPTEDAKIMLAIKRKPNRK